MTRLGDWLKAHWKAEPDTMPDDLASLTAQLEESLADADSRYHIYARMENVDPPHAGLIKECESPHCIRNCAALAACKEFMERHE